MRGTGNAGKNYKTNKMACAPSEDSDQPGHLPSLIRVFAVHMKKAWVLRYPLSPQRRLAVHMKKARVLSYPLSAQRRLWSDWADAQADLNLRRAPMPFCWFCHEAAQMLTEHSLQIHIWKIDSIVFQFSQPARKYLIWLSFQQFSLFSYFLSIFFFSFSFFFFLPLPLLLFSLLSLLLFLSLSLPLQCLKVLSGGLGVRRLVINLLPRGERT